MPEGDPAFGQIVGGEFQGYFVASEHPNAVSAKPSGQVSENDAIMFQLDAKQTAGEFL